MLAKNKRHDGRYENGGAIDFECSTSCNSGTFVDVTVLRGKKKGILYYFQTELSLVEFSFEDFRVSAKKDEKYLTAFQVSLLSLRAEDLTQPPESPSRFFLRSLKNGGGGRIGRGVGWNSGDGPSGRKRRSSTSGRGKKGDYRHDADVDSSDDPYCLLSTSCPNSSVYLPPAALSSSLPDKLDATFFSPFHYQEKRKKKTAAGNASSSSTTTTTGETRSFKSGVAKVMAIPQTPPPSPSCATPPRKMSQVL